MLPIWATILGLVSAVGYTAANIGLRTVSDCDPVWVSCVKSLPTLIFVAPFFWWQLRKQKVQFVSRRFVVVLVVTSILGQLGGNAVFQWSLGVIGIALSVPLTLGALIVSGAIMGRYFLGEPVTSRTLVAIVLLTLSVFVLSLGAESAHASVVGSLVSDVSWWHIGLGVGGALFAGTSYAVLGVVLRYGMSNGTSVSFALFVVSVVGVISLGGVSLNRFGVDVLHQYSLEQYGVMLAAGVFNALAFLALTKAFQLAPMVYINAINGSQAAMAAVAGVIIFRESPTSALWIGVVLTIFGVAILDRQQESDGS